MCEEVLMGQGGLELCEGSLNKYQVRKKCPYRLKKIAYQIGEQSPDKSKKIECTRKVKEVLIDQRGLNVR